MALADEIKDAARRKRLLIGTSSVLRAAAAGGLQRVFLAANCPERTRETLARYAAGGLAVEQLAENSTRLGEICGKPFLILAVGIAK